MSLQCGRVAYLLLLGGCLDSKHPADTGCPSTGQGYLDADGDGFGDPSTATACAPEGYVTNGDDCDDLAAGVHPGATEVWYDGADADCSGGSDFNQDADGYERDEECDDLDPEAIPSPSAEEVWYDGVDDDCDGNDEDQDGDGWYIADYPFAVPAAYQARQGDCADDPASPPTSLNGLPWNRIGAIGSVPGSNL